MYNMTPEHLAELMLRARAETALHVHNVGIYGNSHDSDKPQWLEVRDYHGRKLVERWTFEPGRKSRYDRAMAKAERCALVYSERVVSARLLELITEDMTKTASRQTIH